MAIPSPEMLDGTFKSQVGSLVGWVWITDPNGSNRPDWKGGQTRLAQVGLDISTESPDGILRHGQRLWVAKGSL
ncbi:hypothetical protein CDL15_Pgr028280 [Punica granatum]|uniref:Uncharacterized protein n=1 Tax=Punica granatum TaxID=22663 RepID=A0A218WZW6_PUNGR|nr:hypothetical protein CDL15_Pgr028280 [Punica granatum]